MTGPDPATAMAAAAAATSTAAATATALLPRSLDSYGIEPSGLLELLKARAQAEPMNVAATAIFFLAVLHTFLAPKLLVLSHHMVERAEKEEKEGEGPGGARFLAGVLHFFGEIEVVFGIWCLPLFAAIGYFHGQKAAATYLGSTVDYTEALFVVVIMAIAATAPILQLAEDLLGLFARLLGGSPLAWWGTILVVGPLLGSFVTEPAAMTICALLLCRTFFPRGPSTVLRYATLGLLFVNVSIGGTLTHFAAPPVLMVAGKWGWGMAEMLRMFGAKAAAAIVVATLLHAAVFWKEFARLGKVEPPAPAEGEGPSRRIPFWVVLVHVLFIAFTVYTSHYPALFIGGFFFFLGFTEAAGKASGEVDLRPPLLVGFFLAALVIHGGLQGWWIAPVIGSLGERALFAGSLVLTAFNDNAAITYLGTLVKGLPDVSKYMLVAGAVAGGGLTVIANAPNLAGVGLLRKWYPDKAISPGGLLLGALAPTLLAAAAFLLL